MFALMCKRMELEIRWTACLSLEMVYKVNVLLCDREVGSSAALDSTGTPLLGLEILAI